MTDNFIQINVPGMINVNGRMWATLTYLNYFPSICDKRKMTACYLLLSVSCELSGSLCMNFESVALMPHLARLIAPLGLLDFC